MSDRRWRWLLRFYPERFRRERGEEYLAFLRRQRGESRYAGPWGALRFWVGVVGGAVVAGLRARLFGEGTRRGLALPGELRRAGRRLRSRPGLAAAVVATLGLAVGIATAIFAVVDGALLDPLPYDTADRLVLVRNDVGVMGWHDRPVGRWIYQPLEEDGSGLFEAVTATRSARVNLLLDEDPRAAFALRATSDFFRVFGVRPALGRAFRAEEDRPENDRVVVLGHDLWLRLFGGDPGAVGRTLTVDGIRREVVGVLPEGFVLPGHRTEMVVPLAPDRSSPPTVGNHDHVVYGLLPPGVSPAEAESRMEAFNRTLRERHPRMDLASFEHRVHLAPLGPALTGDLRPTLLLLLGAGGLLFLLACANVSNLLLARAEARRTEQSVRLSLGASHRALAGEALAESLLLAAAGTLLGLAVAHLVLGAVELLPPELLPWTVAGIGLGGAPLAFAAGAAGVATLVVGILPAFNVRRTRPSDLLGGDRRSGGAAGRSGFRRGLVVSQVFLSVVLLSGAALLGRTLLELASTDPGFRAERVLSLDIQLPRATYPEPEAVADFARRLAQGLSARPGVEGAAVVDRIPLRDHFDPSAIRIEGQDPEAEGRPAPDAAFQVVAGDYLGAMGIALLQGRPPRQGEPGVAVNRTFVDRLLPEGRPLQQRIALSAGDFLPVVGVVEDVRLDGVDREPPPQIYYPMDAWAELVEKVDQWDGMYAGGAVPLGVVIRATGETAAVTELVRGELAGLDAGIPVAGVRTLEEVVSADRARPRLTALVVGALALAGLLLAAVGTYAVLAHSVRARGRELGIRLALGASPRELWVRTTLSGLGLAAVGMAAGLVAAWAGAGALDGLLFGVRGDDLGTYVGVALLVGSVAVLASLGPALRAARVDPVESIRE